MKKITTLIFICLVACSGHVFSHEIGVNKHRTEYAVSTTLPVELNSLALVMNYECVSFDMYEDAVSFTYFSKTIQSNNLNNINARSKEYDLKTHRKGLFSYNISTSKENKTNLNCAIVVGKLYLLNRIFEYSMIKATPLPKHYLLPPKNESWCFGSKQRNC